MNSRIWYPAFGSLHPAFGSLHLASGIQHSAACIRHEPARPAGILKATASLVFASLARSLPLPRLARRAAIFLDTRLKQPPRPRKTPKQICIGPAACALHPRRTAALTLIGASLQIQPKQAAGTHGRRIHHAV
jgi:hypothetical protein